MRIKVLQVAIAVIFLFLAIALFYFQVIRVNTYQQLSISNCIRLIPQEGIRGRILDRNGKVIVDSQLSYDVLFFPQENQDLEKTFSKLAQILGVTAKDLQSKFKTKGRFASTPVILVENIGQKKAILIEEFKSELPGVIVQPQPIRAYPYAKVAAHILGYLSEIDQWRLDKLQNYGYKSKDMVGYGGVEERYDYFLKAAEGGLQIEVDNHGRMTKVIGFRPAKSGKDIQLTIDLRIQRIIEDAIGDWKGAIIVLEPYSGEILGMASFPNFSPALFLGKSSAKESILRDPGAPLFNRAICGLYPPGSVFKTIVATAGMDTKKITTATSFFCSGRIKVGNQEYECWNVHGEQNLINAIIHSCNVFFYRLGLLVGPDKIYDYALRFGLGRATQIDLPQEASGFVPNPLRKRLRKLKTWFPGDTANFAIGQGDLLVTPLQVARMMAAIANGSYLPRPHLIKAVAGREVQTYKKMTGNLNLKTEILTPLKIGLEGVVMDSSGTANILAFPDFSISGKTGTAQVSRGQPHAWFAGFFPTKKPKFTLCVFLEHAGPSYNACVVARNIIEAMKKEGLL